MIEEINLVNNSSGVSLHISELNTDFILESMYFGTIPAQISTYKAIGQIGTYVAATSLDPRSPYMTGWVVGRTHEQLDMRKAILNSFVNPMETMTIECYHKYRITGRPIESIKYGESWAENNDVMCKFMITWYCEDPCFYEFSPRTSILADWIPWFHFPVIIPADKGTEFGHRHSSLVGIVPNVGDVDVGFDLVFEAIGTVHNPYLMNLTTQEIIRINYTMLNGDIITVRTGFNEKSVKLTRNNVTTDIFSSFVLPESTFFQLHRGGNVLRYGTTPEIDNENILVRLTSKVKFLEVQDGTANL